MHFPAAKTFTANRSAYRQTGKKPHSYFSKKRITSKHKRILGAWFSLIDLKPHFSQKNKLFLQMNY